MLQITFFQDSNLNIVAVEAEGHTELAESGSDIACAAASALLQATFLGLVRILNITVGFEKEDSYFYFTIPQNIELSVFDKAQILLKTLQVSFEEIKNQFPDRIIIILNKTDDPDIR